MHALRALIFLVFAAGLPFAAPRAQVTEIYKCTDAGGRPLYTSDKKDTAGKKCELVSREVNVVPAQKPAARPGGGPRESGADRANALDRQRGILENELNPEEGLLAKAKQELAEQESQRSGDERNYAKVLER